MTSILRLELFGVKTLNYFYFGRHIVPFKETTGNTSKGFGRPPPTTRETMTQDVVCTTWEHVNTLPLYNFPISIRNEVVGELPKFLVTIVALRLSNSCNFLRVVDSNFKIKKSQASQNKVPRIMDITKKLLSTILFFLFLPQIQIHGCQTSSIRNRFEPKVN